MDYDPEIQNNEFKFLPKDLLQRKMNTAANTFAFLASSSSKY